MGRGNQREGRSETTVYLPPDSQAAAQMNSARALPSGSNTQTATPTANPSAVSPAPAAPAEAASPADPFDRSDTPDRQESAGASAEWERSAAPAHWAALAPLVGRSEQHAPADLPAAGNSRALERLLVLADSVAVCIQAAVGDRALAGSLVVGLQALGLQAIGL